MTHVNGNSVSAMLELSRKVYATSLVLYPNELRREFGADPARMPMQAITFKARKR